MKKGERKIGGQMVVLDVWLRGKKGDDFDGARVFSPQSHQKSISPTWRELDGK